jgi:hypothetical protein
MFARRPGARFNRGRFPERRRAFNGNFAQLFASLVGAGNVWQVIQSDLGVTEGATLLDGGGIGPVLTFSGTRTGVPTPIWVKCTFAGILGVWTYNIYYDGTGTTPAMSGTSAASIPLTGAGAGLTLNIAAGAAVLNNLWKATVGAVADQSAAPINYAQGTGSLQPLISTGLNGNVGFAADGVDDFITSALNLPAASVTPGVVRAVWRQNAWASGATILGSDNAGQSMMTYQATGGASPNINAYNGLVVGPNGGAAIGTWVRQRQIFSNSAGDYTRLGATTTSGNASNLAGGTGRSVFARTNGAGPSAAELVLLAYLKVDLSAAQDAVLDAAITTKYGATVVL